ncbi:MAG: sigma-70 family RNA polymerase sigma factor [Xanthomonadales bacterium]|nr:sigma-70 family RNA polymerase sigma factor [Xanthomonadales bacterium]
MSPMPGQASSHTTEVLLQRIRDGDDAAREALLRRVLPLFERWARGRLPDRARGAVETADLVQMSVLSAMRGVDRFESAHPGAFFAYLRAILLNAVRKTIGLEAVPGGRLAVEDVEDELVEGGSTLEALVGRENLIAYEQALHALSPAHQALVVMRFELGMSFPEIAAELGESIDGVRVKLNRALKKMVLVLGDGDGS